MHRRFLAAAAAAIALAACSGQQGAQNGTKPGAALHNPVDFPLYPGSSLLSTHAFTQVVNAGGGSGQSVFANGNGTYSGDEVIASTPASFQSVAAWVDKLNDSPPPGYTPAETGGDPNAREQSRRIGIDYAVFTRKTGGHTRGVLLLAMDPRMVNEHFGVVLGLIAKYRSLPGVMRDPIDNQVKQRIGMTITEATQPDSPVGAALSALDQFEHKDARGIVLLDATKR
ncbi:MAG TPA: hypothetical protein VGZ02_15310 [Candidatus Baltobacteraceae bacterium]|jgi:hypothetical protein|nr:hypothetical protein [Candidatus Baltobacteraceae bacterium]